MIIQAAELWNAEMQAELAYSSYESIAERMKETVCVITFF